MVLKKGEKRDDLIEYERGIFETSMSMDVWDTRRIKITLELASSYESRREISTAEELYVMLWARLTEHCHQPKHAMGIDIHISMLDVALEYVRFLRRLQRHEEAANVLICIWTEYEEYHFESETIFLRLKMIGEYMRAISLLSVALSVFKKCLGWFRSHGKQEYVSSCELLISKTVQEIITTTTTTATTTTETVVKEVFELTVSRSSVTLQTVSIWKNLISFYMKHEQWSAAIDIIKRSLSLIWKAVVNGVGTYALPNDFNSDAVDFALRLAVCYHRSHFFHEAEETYERVYRAVRNSCHIQDEQLITAYTTLIEFYREHRRWAKIIKIYQELLVDYRKLLGASHALTIKVLYSLGSLCSDHGHRNADEYYVEIIKVLNGDSNVCCADAMDAAIVLCRNYYEGGHWHKLHNICKVLWHTWIHHHHERKFDAAFVEILYVRYRYVLEKHIHCKYDILRYLTIEYRDTCVKVYGAAVTITIKALLELAEINMRSEKHIHEAIASYEEVSHLVLIKTMMLSVIDFDQDCHNYEDYHNSGLDCDDNNCQGAPIPSLHHSLSSRLYVNNCS